LTVKNGRTVYDLNGIARDDWDKLPANYGSQSDVPRSGGQRGAPAQKK
jgi:hypothetical protein